ncbi:MAG: DotI/IcmL/TraM family protein [Defluviicoccus sp.]|nr:DotI/IcmL/TraM family protein [Defluviicoccus sp.]MDE0276395.1 DotI/IcmL/TraM family protein [Defluviicoccus sp.]
MSRLLALSKVGNLFAFQRAQHHAWRRVAGYLALSNLATAAALVGYVWFHSTTYITVAATEDGKLIPLTPLDERIMSDVALKNWAVAAVTEAFTLGHHDWRRRLSAVRKYFTDDGYDSFVKGLEESLFLDRLKKNRQVASAVANGAPVITDTRKFEGKIAWAIEFPMLLTFQAGTRRRDQKLVARVLVIRVPLSERATGIGIAQLIASRGKAG